MKIGYIRVSTQEQNTIRQEELMTSLGVEQIYIDRMSGKNTNRPELQNMMDFIRKGDTVVVESISRFARNTRDLLDLVMLIGTVVNSSIVLVDYIHIRRERGQPKLEACPLRIRPILMTTLTTVLALIPMAKGVGEGNEILEPMGVVMITGMVISTVVTLFFTPVCYSMLDSLAETLTGPFRRRRERKKARLTEELEALEKQLGIEGPEHSSER